VRVVQVADLISVVKNEKPFKMGLFFEPTFYPRSNREGVMFINKPRCAKRGQLFISGELEETP
jgi:hypothetical protein